MLDFNTVVNGILTAVIIAAIPAIGTLVIMLIHKGIKYVESKTKNSNIASILDRLDSVAGAVVQTIEATFVKAAKAGDTWDDPAKAAAFESAFNATLGILGKDATQFLADSSMDVTALVTNKIEALNKYLNGSSAGGGAAAPVSTPQDSGPTADAAPAADATSPYAPTIAIGDPGAATA